MVRNFKFALECSFLYHFVALSFNAFPVFLVTNQWFAFLAVVVPERFLIVVLFHRHVCFAYFPLYDILLSGVVISFLAA